MVTETRLILASTSPRRREILSLLGIPFKVVAPKFQEVPDKERSPKEEAVSFAKAKAESVADDFPRHIILGCDTLIECEGHKVGKPEDRKDAIKILQLLQGKSHTIWSAVAMMDTSENAPVSVLDTTRIQVKFNKMSDADIDAYVATGEPLDKAGAYSLQGGARQFITDLEGDYLGAVGLSLKPVVGFLASRGINIPVDVEKIYREKSFLNWKTFKIN
jgi:septum formation protein